MSTAIATTIPQYLDQLRAALAGADPALVQDALYDAEEYLRSEWAEHPALEEAALLSGIAGSYGAPDEVAGIYRDTEVTVRKAMRTPPPAPRRTAVGRFFGVLADPHAYASVLYMLLAMATGTFYFTWVVTGLSLSLGLAILIIGIPFAILFLASVRGLALVEGRLVETLLGERMPRRPPYSNRDRPVMQRIAAMFTDPRTWTALLYMLLMLPLGTAYFTAAVIALSLSLGVALIPVAGAYGESLFTWDGMSIVLPLWTTPLTIAVGLLMLVLTMHGARGVGRLHAQLAKHLLVRAAD
ncbi:sensor domain-containing protein [soil metagenome]